MRLSRLGRHDNASIIIAAVGTDERTALSWLDMAAAEALHNESSALE